jgi:hypothetical protein
LSIFRKSVENIQASLKYDMYIYDNISLKSS